MLNITDYQRNANENHNEVPFIYFHKYLFITTNICLFNVYYQTSLYYHNEVPSIYCLQTINAGEGADIEEPSHTVGVNAN